MYPHRFETRIDVAAPPEAVFAILDDQERLGAHMTKSSAMMGGGAMHYSFDAGRGRAVGSRIEMRGEAMGVHLELAEVVTERAPPLRKAWETVGEPHLLVVGRYRMGFEISPRDDGSDVLVFIDYDDPAGPWALLGRLLGPVYARWCTTSMAEAAREAAGGTQPQA